MTMKMQVTDDFTHQRRKILNFVLKNKSTLLGYLIGSYLQLLGS